MNNLKMNQIGYSNLKVTNIGMGGAPLVITEESNAIETLLTAYNEGIRYFDTAPYYGAGISEKYFGNFLSSVERNSFVISSKVGRIIENQEIRFDYTREGILRSLEESLERLNLDYIDIALIHDPDDHYHQALDESFPTLSDLKSQGIIKAIGCGMNQWQMLFDFANNADFDCFLLAGRYTLLDHSAMYTLMPKCLEKNISIILGGPYNSGILASDFKSESTYFYEPTPTKVTEKTRLIKNVCDKYEVPLKAAALQFGLNHPSVASTIPGPSNPDELIENLKMVNININNDLWKELKDMKLIDEKCPENLRG
jgi:D-threo-aldose 1-dehydrogenase|tara:strand:+ start:4242 stop:5177 length:936 start_codon:yes stop_codon:yes gene_type:complete